MACFASYAATKRSAAARSAVASPDDIHSPALPRTTTVAVRSRLLIACTSALAASSVDANVCCEQAAAHASVATNATTKRPAKAHAHSRAVFQRRAPVVVSMAYLPRSIHQRRPPPPRPPPPMRPPPKLPAPRAAPMLEEPRLLKSR